ncbi:serine protease 30-like [Saccoglossus kowalevskii]
MRYRQCLDEVLGCRGEEAEYQLCEMNDCVEADSGCGSRVTVSQPRIVGGEDALPGEAPWQAQMFYIPHDDVVCGGTLVGPKHVISAAHCFDNPPNPAVWMIRLGRYTRGKPLSPADGESVEVGVEEIIIHEKYDTPVDSDNDIALVILDTEVDPSDFINYACLNYNITFHGDSSCFVSGWGTLQQGGSLPNILQKAYVPILPDDICRILNGESSVTDNMMCAGYIAGGIDSCQGDSGGPLVCINTDENTGISRWHLAGITSWGYGCALANNPGVYTRVSRYYEWLHGHGAM